MLIIIKNLTLNFCKSQYRYIYGGILSLNEQDTSDILKVLTAADELSLQEIVDYLQKYLIEISPNGWKSILKLLTESYFISLKNI